MSELLQPLYLRADELPNLPSGWRPAKVDDIAELLKPGRLYDEKSVAPAGDVPVVNQSKDDFHGYHSEEPGVLASDDRPVSTFANHTCAMRLMRRPYSCIQNIFSRVGKPGVSDTVFFHYSTLGRVRLSGYKGHHPIYRDTWIPLPPIDVQQRIASIISAYDDLIENNRRRMALLENAARLLFQEWFVRLRFPGHERTKVGNGVPEGWEIRRLDECARFLSGGTPSKAVAEFWKGDIPWISSGELTEFRIKDAPLRVTAEAVEQGSRSVPVNTILAVVRGMSLAKEFRVSITAGSVAFNQDLKALVSVPDVDPVYLFSALLDQKEQIRERATEASHGTKKLETSVLSAIQISVPTDTLQKRFRELMEPINGQWDNLKQQNQKLRAARDLLLPRLMSGEIEV